MEERNTFGSGHKIKVNETAGSFQVLQIFVQCSGTMGKSSAPAQEPAPASVAAAMPCSIKGKKKRGRSSNFQVHELAVNSGEDVTMKIMHLSQQKFHAICILSANGTISKVTLCDSISGGTSTYEGIFKILSLNGSFIPTENGLTKSRCGELSVSFKCLDGRVIGGALAGLLMAAGPVQVRVGSFLPSLTQEQKAKNLKVKLKVKHMSTTAPTTHLCIK